MHCTYGIVTNITLKWGAISLKRSILKKTRILTPFNVKIASNYMAFYS